MEKVTLNRAIELFLGGKKKTTRNSYKYILWSMRDYIGLTKHIAELQPYHLDEYLNIINNRDIADATYNKHIKTIKVFFNWCVKRKLCSESPVSDITYRKIYIQPDEAKAMPEHILERLLDYVRFHPREHALVLFLADTGCRIGGAAALQWTDIDFDNLRATVEEKGQPPRPVFFGKECKKALLKWNLKQKRNHGNYVFSFRGGRINNNSLGLHFERQVKNENTGIRGSWGAHSLRHRLGHRCAQMGFPPTYTQKLLGHADIQMTLNYYYPKDWKGTEEKARLLHQRNTEKPRRIVPLHQKVEDL